MVGSIALVGALGLDAIAIDSPMAGRKLVVKTEPAAKKRKFVARTNFASASLPNPQQTDTALIVSEVDCSSAPCTANATSGEIKLDRNAWSALGNPPGSEGYRYKDKSAALGGVRSVAWKASGKLVIKAGGSDWPLVPAGDGTGVRLSFRTSTNDFCAEFGGEQKRHQPGFMVYAKADAPPSCSGTCGDSVVDSGEDCDPPDGLMCDTSCRFACADDVAAPVVACSSRLDNTVGFAGDGDDFIVAYSDLATEGARIYGVRLDSAGAVLDAPALELSSSTASPRSPLAIQDVSGFYALWSSSSSQFAKGRRIPVTGSTLGAVESHGEIPPHGGGQCGTALGPPLGLGANLASTTPHVSAAETAYCPEPLATWLVGVPGAGALLEPPYIFDFPPAAFSRSATDVAAVWVRGEGISPPQFSLQMNWIEPMPLGQLLQLTSLPHSVSPVGLAALGDTFLAVWATGGEVRGVRFDAATGVLDPDGGFLVGVGAGTARMPAVASDGSQFVVVWNDDDGVTDSLLAVHVLADGTVIEATPSVLVSVDEIVDTGVAGGVTSVWAAIATIEPSGAKALRVVEVP